MAAMNTFGWWMSNASFTLQSATQERRFTHHLSGLSGLRKRTTFASTFFLSAASRANTIATSHNIELLNYRLIDSKIGVCRDFLSSEDLTWHAFAYGISKKHFARDTSKEAANAGMQRPKLPFIPSLNTRPTWQVNRVGRSCICIWELLK